MSFELYSLEPLFENVKGLYSLPEEGRGASHITSVVMLGNLED